FLGPALPNRTFISVWNAPTSACESRWGININLSSFDIVTNRGQTFYGESIVLLYSNIGLWPYINDKGDKINGGIPQLGNLSAHLDKALHDLLKVVPDPDFQGIGVIDWEAWRPVFDRNWDSKTIYKEASEALVKQQHPDWSSKAIETEARKQFEDTAKDYMLQTLQLAKKTRHKALWGYYGFPRCYNSKGPSDCSGVVKAENDQLSWMFESSSIIFPSIYLSPSLPRNRSSTFAKYNILEAFRLAVDEHGSNLPVFPYVRIVYAQTQIFLNKADMYSTIVQAAKLGTAGVIIWGASSDMENAEFCTELYNYIEGFVGPLIKTLSDIAQDCSMQYCSFFGRC
ncbi:predicted protein, partial [Nematostella vectensis]